MTVDYRLLEAVNRKAEAKVAELDREYWPVVAAAAAGERLDPDAATGGLDRTRRTAAEFSMDCHRAAKLKQAEQEWAWTVVP